MKTLPAPPSQSEVEAAIRVLNEEEPSFGNTEYFQANRLISSLSAIECDHCDSAGQEVIMVRNVIKTVVCRRCKAVKRGYRGRLVYWTGWARVTKNGVSG